MKLRRFAWSFQKVVIERLCAISQGERTIRRILKKYDLHVKIRRAFKVTTDSKHSHRVYPNLLKDKVPKRINEVWASDFTYIRIENSFVYLAVILDLYSRKVVGWAISKNIDAALALKFS